MRSHWRAPLMLGALMLVGSCSPQEVINVIPISNNRIAFASSRDGNYEIYVMEPDGTGQVNITHNPALDYMPTWSPDGTKIAFASDRSGTKQIWVMDPDGTNVTRLTSNSLADYSPAWSPDGTKIAFTRDVTPTHQQIFVMSADGTSQINISNTTHNDIQPAWKPNGTMIAFSSDRHAAPAPNNSFFQIYTMTATGNGVTRQTVNDAGIDYYPAWSQYGTIAFTRDRGADAACGTADMFDVWQLDVPSGRELRLTDDDCAQDGQPSWSPDGKRIVYISDRASPTPLAFDVWVMTPGGTAATRLTTTQADQLPAWSKN